MNFLQKVVDEVKVLPLDVTLVVFPTRRASIEFKNDLAKVLSKTSWLPVVLPISDLINFIYDKPVTSKLNLLVILFNSYQNIGGKDSFDQFLKWGEQLLNDFDEIDRQLIPAESIFKRVIDIKEIEATFELDEEELENLYTFWNQFSNEKLTPLKTLFLNNWEIIPALYTAFNAQLDQSNLAYEGKAWKAAVKQLKNNEYFNQYKHIVFAGFYALTKCESEIIKHLQQENKILLYKDADSWYTESKHQEAGRYFRKGVLSDAKIPWTGNLLSESKKNINVIGVGGKMAMARELSAAIISQFKNAQDEETNQTVVVLPDDSLLFPFLLDCSRAGIPLNPSMGFPVSHHPSIHILKRIRLIRKDAELLSDKFLKSKEATWLINHPYLVSCLNVQELEELKKIEQQEESNNVNSVISKLLLSPPKGIQEETKLFFDLIKLFETNKDDKLNEVIKSTKKESLRICNELAKHENILTIDAWWNLLLSELSSLRVPFLIENKKGIHVMGFLETRVLDYKNVFIASLNEGTLPGSSIPKSAIPYSIRKLYQLPCKEEQDAVTAFHFYRLLQRAQNISLFYNNTLDELGQGEKSRFLLQINHELSVSNPNITIKYQQIEQKIASTNFHEITIAKSEEIVNQLKKKFIVTTDNSPKGFSASSISSYIACPLRFYFDQIARIRPDLDSDSIDSPTFGLILHESMQLLYENANPINKELIETSKLKIDEVLAIAIEKNYKKGILTGNDFLLQGVIKELIFKILRIDEAYIPFEVQGLEEKIDREISLSNGVKVKCSGSIDRIDFKNGITRILDYKTGNDQIKLPDDLSLIFTDAKYKTIFQLLFYVCAKKATNENIKVNAGIYRLRSNEEEVLCVSLQEVIDDSLIDLAEKEIKRIIEEILNKDLVFDQTKNHDNCKFCSYRKLCDRTI
jgi:hypothetical protein